jgi:hypothetical protein
MTNHWIQLGSSKIIWVLVTQIFSLLSFSQDGNIRKDEAKDLFSLTVKIQGIRDTIINNKHYKINSIGTGFLFNYIEGRDSFPFIITNAHVIENCETGILRFNVANGLDPVYGNVLSIKLTNFSKLWIKHPSEDIAAIAFQPIYNAFQKKLGKRAYASSFNEIHLLTKDREKNLSSLQEVLMVGYPKGFSDTINNIPILRKGTVATPIFIDYNSQKRFLLDIPIYPGSSGSPVILFPATFIKEDSSTKHNVILAGIAVESKTYEAKGQVVSKDKQKSLETITNLPFEIAIVIKSSVLLDWRPIVFQLIKDGKVLNPINYIQEIKNIDYTGK